MANLPNDTLPGEFDVIVVGTGLVQCIVAAAAARIGKSVLHLDGNPYYGDLWGTLMHRDLCDWISQHGDGVANDEGNDPVIPTPNEGEVFIPCNNVNKITNIVEINHGRY
jgi:RAB protein geranylgeranyltransferase component A